MASQFHIRTKDIPLLVRALQSLETVPDSWFGPVDDPSLISEMKNAARALPAKLQLKRFSCPILMYWPCSRRAAISVWRWIFQSRTTACWKITQTSLLHCWLRVILVCYSSRFALRTVCKRHSLCPPQAGFLLPSSTFFPPFMRFSPAGETDTPSASPEKVCYALLPLLDK